MSSPLPWRPTELLESPLLDVFSVGLGVAAEVADEEALRPFDLPGCGDELRVGRSSVDLQVSLFLL